MNIFKPTVRCLKAHRLCFFAVVTILLTGCNTSQQALPAMPDTLSPGLTVVGVVAKSGLKAPLDSARMSTDLAALLAGRGDAVVTPSIVIRQIIGAGPHDEMMAFYARHGRLAPYQAQRMMAANLPSSSALFVRLEADTIEHLPMARTSVIDTAGRVVSDRERLIYTTRRTTQVSAMLMNLHNGRITWTRQYKVSPETTVAANHHTGGSFSASLAAAVANTIVHGVDDRQHPEAPELSASVLALLQEVAYNVPVK